MKLVDTYNTIANTLDDGWEPVARQRTIPGNDLSLWVAKVNLHYP
jgi:hypothetical protein